MDRNYEDYDEMIREKTVKKQAIMNDEEIKEAEQFLLWYRRAYEDKVRVRSN